VLQDGWVLFGSSSRGAAATQVECAKQGTAVSRNAYTAVAAGGVGFFSLVQFAAPAVEQSGHGLQAG
jgi:hypothetical protein